MALFSSALQSEILNIERDENDRAEESHGSHALVTHSQENIRGDPSAVSKGYHFYSTESGSWREQ